MKNPRRRRAVRRRMLVAALTAMTLLAGLLPATQPDAAADELSVDRSAVVSVWRLGGGKVRAAAEVALVGSDDDARAFLNGGMQAAQHLDERDAVAGVISDGGPALRAAAQQALDADAAGDQNALVAFMSSGWQAPSDVDARVRVNQLMAAGGEQVKQAAQAALDSEDPAVLREFLDSGWQLQWQTDQRIRVNQAMATGGPEVQAATQKALDDGTPEALEEFLDYGWAVASARDEESATLTGLLAQAQASGEVAAQETQRATDEADRAQQAADAARRAAAEAAQATADAQNNAAEAAAQAKRAAAAAEKAAEAAQVAVRAAAAASRAARAASTAASRAASAASRAERAAATAYKQAAAAASDASKAGAARQAAETANAIAREVRNFADTADQAGKAIQAGMAAVNAAKSAAQHAKTAAAANDEAVRSANNAGADAKEAVAAAQLARANADRAVRAANAAQNYLQVAINAAFAARDAANRAASDAEAAARAAIDAANHAGEAAEAARRATEAADAATVAAQAAVDLSIQAIAVFNAARDADAERLAVIRDEGLEVAHAANALYQAQQSATRWDSEQAAKRDAETNRLIAEAQNPATDPATAVKNGRRIALTLTAAPGVWTQQAALAALAGSDERVLVFVRTGLAEANAQDDRQAVMDITVSDNTDLADAAKTALTGSDADVSNFLRIQNYPGRDTQDRIKVNQILAAAQTAGDVVVRQKAQEALDAGTAQALRDFISTGQYTAAAVGQRVRVNQILASADSGPETKVAAQIALDGPAPALQEFLDNGQYTAVERDQASAAHLAVVGGLLEKINEVATTAVQNALEAQSMAAQARGDAAKAADYANQAAIGANGAAKRAYDAAINANQSAQAAAAAAEQAYKTYQSAQGHEIAACNAEYASGPAPELEQLLNGTDGEWYRNCVSNVIADPAELVKRAYTNSAFCSLYPDGSQLHQNCLHSVLNPEFKGMQPLIFFAQIVQGIVAMLAPVGVVAAAGCLATVVCGAVAGTFLTIGDVGLSIFKYINGDQSLAQTLMHLGQTALESLLLAGIGKALSAGFRSLKALHVAAQAAKKAETQLQVINLARLNLNGLATCLDVGHSFAPQTPVVMTDGSRTPISEIKMGDRLLATDPATGHNTSE